MNKELMENEDLMGKILITATDLNGKKHKVGLVVTDELIKKHGFKEYITNINTFERLRKRLLQKLD